MTDIRSVGRKKRTHTQRDREREIDFYEYYEKNYKSIIKVL